MDTFQAFNIPKPTDDQILLWFQAVLLWVISNYTSAREPTERDNGAEQELPTWKPSYKALSTTLCCVFLAGFTKSLWPMRILLGLALLISTSALPWFRIRCAKHEPKEKSGLAEIEIIANLAFLFVSAAIIIFGNMHIYAAIRPPISDRHLAFILAMISGTIFLMRGGTRIVRGVLDDSGVAPKIEDSVKPEPKEPSPILVENTKSPAQAIDTKEYNRGRLIGDIERLLLLIVVMAGKDETLGLIIVAKGLIRSRQFENRDLTEYVIVGTLVSTVLAIAVGLALKYLSDILW